MNTFLICRTCLIEKNPAECIQLLPKETYNDVPLSDMVQLCIPELNLLVQPYPTICIECIQSIFSFYEFKIMCLKNNSEYPKLITKECIVENHISYKPSPDSDIRLNCEDTISDIISSIDVNQNESSKDINALGSKNNIKKKKFTFYRNRFMNENCAGCKNRILNVKYHSKVYNGYYDCFNCGKRFTTIAEIRKHIYTHTLSYKCEICGKKWRGKYALEIHLRSHTKEKPFECPVCDKKFVQSYSLHQHLGIHQKQDSHNQNRCSVCAKVLSTKYNLKIHMTTHRLSGRPKCSRCNKWFYTQAAVMKHLETCVFSTLDEESGTNITEPEFIKTEIPDIKEELNDDTFFETPSSPAESTTFGKQKDRCSRCNKCLYNQTAVLKHSQTCAFDILSQENEDTVIQPQYVKIEIPDFIKEELADDIFLETTSSSVAESRTLERQNYS